MRITARKNFVKTSLSAIYYSSGHGTPVSQGYSDVLVPVSKGDFIDYVINTSCDKTYNIGFLGMFRIEKA